MVIASIQKLSRTEGIAALEAAEPFDYCVVDEVHHAEAPSYRRVLARLKSTFTLGLTATPERTDGVDVATLFDDILAAQATIGDGIAEGSLVPFRYRGLKDDVDFERIPWRNGRFDVGELEAALENSARMERLWAEWQIGARHQLPGTGTSMVPLIPDGSWCLLRPYPAGSREGRIVLVQFAVKRRGRERRPVHRQEVPLGAIYRFGRHRRRLAALFDSAPAAESGVRADHARAGGR